VQSFWHDEVSHYWFGDPALPSGHFLGYAVFLHHAALTAFKGQCILSSSLASGRVLPNLN
jgi:uncharacterized protein YjaZ